MRGSDTLLNRLSPIHHRPASDEKQALPGREHSIQLPPEQTARFYRIWLALLRYVNQERHLVPTFSASEKDAPLALSDEMQVRNALWADDTLREQFMALNPAGLPASDLAVVAS